MKDDLVATRSFLIGSVTKNSCPTENSISYGQLEYSLTSELDGDEVLHRVRLAPDHEFNNDVFVHIRLPSLLSYIKYSSQLNTQVIEDPVIKDNNLSYILSASHAHRELTFRTALNKEYRGIFSTSLTVNLKTDKPIDESNIEISNQYEVNDIAGDKILITNDRGKNGILNVQPIHQQAGVQDIRLYMEDGRYVLTDERGMFHFEAIQPGTHVVSLDPSSIPDHLEIHECVNNTRTAGARYSQFVDIQPGLLWRANFYLREKQDNYYKVLTNLNSHVVGDKIDYQFNINGLVENIENVRISILLPEGIEYIARSSSLNNQSIKDPINTFGTLTFRLSDFPLEKDNNSIKFSATASPKVQGEVSTQAIITYDQGDVKNQRLDSVHSTILFQNEKTHEISKMLRSNFNSLSAELNEIGISELNDFI